MQCLSRANPNFPAHNSKKEKGMLLFDSININTLLPEVGPRFVNLGHEFFVSLGNVVKSEDTPAELEQKVCAE